MKTFLHSPAETSQNPASAPYDSYFGSNFPFFMSHAIRFSVLLFSLVLLAGCLGEFDPSGEEERSAAPFLSHDPHWADSLVAELDEEELAAQLLWCVERPSANGGHDSLFALAHGGGLGGLFLIEQDVERFQVLQDSLARIGAVPLMLGVAPGGVHAGLPFGEDLPYPTAQTFSTIQDPDLMTTAGKHLGRVDSLLGLGLGFLPALGSGDTKHNLGTDSLASLKASHLVSNLQGPNVLACLGPLVGYKYIPNDTSHFLEGLLSPYQSAVDRGLSAMLIAPEAFLGGYEGKRPKGYLEIDLHKTLHYQGLLIGYMPDSVKADPAAIRDALYAGCDVLLIEGHLQTSIEAMREVAGSGDIAFQGLQHKARRVLLAKDWSGMRSPLVRDSVFDAEWTWCKREQKLLKRQLYEAGGLVLDPKNDRLPLAGTSGRFLVHSYGPKKATHLFHFGEKHLYIGYSEQLVTSMSEALPALPVGQLAARNPVILAFSARLDAKRDTAFLASLKELQSKTRVVLAHFGPIDQLAVFDSSHSIVQIERFSPFTQEVAAGLLFGGLEGKGKLAYDLSPRFPLGMGTETERTRLHYGIPEDVGMHPDTLRKIDYLVRRGINNKGMPGCQVLVAKNGRVVYQKSFGHHDYDHSRKVDNHDLYDIASITKVVSTTLSVMKLYDKKQIGLSDSLEDYLKDRMLDKRFDLKMREVRVRDIQFCQLLTHQSGLPEGLNILPFVHCMDKPWCHFTQYYCEEDQGTGFTLEVADGFFMRKDYKDTLLHSLLRQPLGPKKYKYSDANMVLLQFMVEQIVGKGINKFVAKEFYSPLGLKTMGYLPLDRFKDWHIVPTEKDRYWRDQVVDGYVHDPTAALMGGVSGNAGIFSNAQDVATIFQMLLQRGHYGGQRFYSAKTVDKFISTQPGSHRGLGFDKPGKTRGIVAKSASKQTFGHSGFTGCIVWADPESDLVFVYLSNAIHPRVENKKRMGGLGVRRNTHEYCYDAIGTFSL